MSERHLDEEKITQHFNHFLQYIPLRKKGESVLIKISVHGPRAHNEGFEGENQVYIRFLKMSVTKECLKSPSPNVAFF